MTSAGVRSNLTEVLAAGDSEIISDGDLVLDRLSIFTAGNSKVRLTGTVNEQLINTAGAIEVDNFDFITQKTSITISGAGDINVYCEVELIISVSGAATIRYKGSPQISQSASGALTLEHID